MFYYFRKKWLAKTGYVYYPKYRIWFNEKLHKAVTDRMIRNEYKRWHKQLNYKAYPKIIHGWHYYDVGRTNRDVWDTIISEYIDDRVVLLLGDK